MAKGKTLALFFCIKNVRITFFRFKSEREQPLLQIYFKKFEKVKPSEPNRLPISILSLIKFWFKRKGDTMSHTIYGGTTKNNIFVSDMVDNHRDIVFYDDENKREHFARFTGWFESEEMDDPCKPAIAIFHKDEPFTPVYAMKLSGNFSDYMQDDYSVNEKFIRHMKACYECFYEFLRTDD